MSELKRATVFAVVPETTIGGLKAPTSATQFVPVRPGAEQTAAVEELANDELVNDIGASKTLTGLETPTGTHPAYLKHSEVEGQEPECGIFYESAFGSKAVAAVERLTAAGSTAGTTTVRAVVNVTATHGASFEVGQALLVKDLTNGYKIRNVRSRATDALTLNFNLNAAPGVGLGLGRSVLYKPVATGHPSFSSWEYGANGGYIGAMAGCKTTSIEMTMPAGEQAEVSFGYSGTESFFNPVVVTATNKFIDFTDDVGAQTATLDEEIFKSPLAFASHVEAKMQGESADTITVRYNSQTGRYTIASDGAVFELNFNTGTNTANSAAPILGFDTVADQDSATSYTSASPMDLAAPYTPSYDGATNIVVKDAELFIGDFHETVCRKASTVSVTVGVEQEQVRAICARSGLVEILPTARQVSLEATVVLDRYEASLFDKFINNKDAEVMVNIGQKNSSGNWIGGRNVNVYMPQATITQHTVGGDTVVEITITARGYISGDRKDMYLNFI